MRSQKIYDLKHRILKEVKEMVITSFCLGANISLGNELKIAEELYEYVKNLLPDIEELTDKEYTLSDLKIDNLGNYGLTLKIDNFSKKEIF